MNDATLGSIGLLSSGNTRDASVLPHLRQKLLSGFQKEQDSVITQDFCTDGQDLFKHDTNKNEVEHCQEFELPKSNLLKERIVGDSSCLAEECSDQIGTLKMQSENDASDQTTGTPLPAKASTFSLPETDAHLLSNQQPACTELEPDTNIDDEGVASGISGTAAMPPCKSEVQNESATSRVSQSVETCPQEDKTCTDITTSPKENNVVSTRETDATTDSHTTTNDDNNNGIENYSDDSGRTRNNLSGGTNATDVDVTCSPPPPLPPRSPRRSMLTVNNLTSLVDPADVESKLLMQALLCDLVRTCISHHA